MHGCSSATEQRNAYTLLQCEAKFYMNLQLSKGSIFPWVSERGSIKFWLSTRNEIHSFSLLMGQNEIYNCIVPHGFWTYYNFPHEVRFQCKPICLVFRNLPRRKSKIHCIQTYTLQCKVRYNVYKLSFNYYPLTQGSFNTNISQTFLLITFKWTTIDN